MPADPRPVHSLHPGSTGHEAGLGAAELGLDRRSIKRIVVGLVVLLLITGVLGFAIREPLTSAAQWFVSELGFTGLFVGVVVIDSWVFPPLTHEPLLFFAHAGGIAFWKIWACAGAASVAAGPVGYLLGIVFGRRGPIARRLRGSPVESLMRRRGPTVVAAAAITPIPFAVTTWLAGAIGVPFGPFLAACLVRLLKVGVYLSLIAAGWAAS